MGRNRPGGVPANDYLLDSEEEVHLDQIEEEGNTAKMSSHSTKGSGVRNTLQEHRVDDKEEQEEQAQRTVARVLARESGTMALVGKPHAPWDICTVIRRSSTKEKEAKRSLEGRFMSYAHGVVTSTTSSHPKSKRNLLTLCINFVSPRTWDRLPVQMRRRQGPAKHCGLAGIAWVGYGLTRII